MERIALARECRVADWLRDACLELTQKTPLDIEALRPAEPYSNPLDRSWEVDAKKWEATFRVWETLARISQLQMKVATLIFSFGGSRYLCSRCDTVFGWSGSSARLCKCRLLVMVNEAFRGELESFGESSGHVEHPLPRKLPISYLCPLKSILYGQQH